MFLFFKENLFQFVLLFLLLIVLVYVTNITSMPDSIILFEDQDFKYNTVFGVKINQEEVVQASSEVVSKEKDETKYDVSMLGVKLKTITASKIPNTKVIPLGDLAGLKLYTKGVLVVGMSEVEGQDNKKYKPYEGTGIEEGDSIIKINDEEIDSTEELLACVSKSKGNNINITYIKSGKEIQKNITPVKTAKNTYKLGIWVRDSHAGIGTLSFYEESTNSIASLGHSIQDVDTKETVDISSGEFVTSKVDNIVKGEKENPGRIEGDIDNSNTLGKIYKNNKFGVFGYITDKNTLNIENEKAIDVCLRNDIEEGEAKIICTLNDGTKEEYKVNIQKIFTNNNKDNKSMIVKVTDERLLSKTGGIIQGMSGSPIIQNGKFVGALTHVLVSDPTTGYGVFADLMIKELSASK